MSRILDWMLTHKGITVAIIVVVTVAFAGMTLRARMSSSLGDMIFGEMPEYQRAIEWAEDMGGDVVLLIGLENAEPSGARFTEAVQRLSELSLVKRVVAPSNVLPDLGLDFLVSPEGHALIELECGIGDAATLERAPLFVENVRTLLVEQGYDADSIHFGGFVAILASVQSESKRSLRVLAPTTAIVLLLMTWLMLRELWPVLLTLVVGVVAVIWMAGFAITIDRDVNVLLAIAPALMFLVAFADVVHLCCAHEQNLRDGHPPEIAVRKCAAEVGRACVFTSITTLLGFAGMLLIDVHSIRRLGLVMGFGTAVALLLALVMTPLVLGARARPRTTRQDSVRTGLAVRLVTRAMRMPVVVVLVFVGLSVIGIIGATRINIETDIATRMSVESDLRRDMVFFDTYFGGIGLIELHVTWSDETSLTDLATGSRELAEELEAREDVTRVLSALTLLDRVPAQVLAAGAGRTLINPEERRARVILQTHETGMSSAYHLGESVASIARSRLGTTTQLEPSGSLYLGGLWLERHVASEGRALVITFTVIMVVVTLVFRSWRIGVAALIPNVFPLLVLGGVLGFLYGDVDSDLVVLAFIAIGLAVDDTIHVLSRYQLVRPAVATNEEAVLLTMRDAGRGVMVTTIVFAVGTLPLALSQYQTVRDIGILLPVVMLAALSADLLLLPALLRLGVVRPPARSKLMR